MSSIKQRFTTRDLVLCALFAALSAAGAFIRIPLPGVAFTLQTLFVLLAGMLLGRRLGPVSIGVYLLTGLFGLPVFTGGGGPAYVLRPSFGYLLGFLLSAWLTGFLTERLTAKAAEKGAAKAPNLAADSSGSFSGSASGSASGSSHWGKGSPGHAPSFAAYFGAGLAGVAAVYALGVPYYYLIMNYYLGSPVGIAATLVNCFLLTLPGDLLKLCLASWLAKRIRPLLLR